MSGNRTTRSALPLPTFQSDRDDDDQRTFIPECQLLYESGPGPLQCFQSCTKNPGHVNFIPVNEFGPKHLPPESRTKEVLELIKYVSDRTVKITLSYISLTRPDNYPYGKWKGRHIKRTGTGYVYGCVTTERDKPCPCSSCKNSGNPKIGYRWLCVKTAAHVVCDDSEAETVVCELFYDTKEEEGIVKLYGVREITSDDLDTTKRCSSDVFYILCISHDMEAEFSFNKSFSLRNFSDVRVPFSLIVSHPHGLSKHITIGSGSRMVTPLAPGYYDVVCPFYFRPGVVNCRLTEDASLNDKSSFQKFLDKSNSCVRGKSYTVHGWLSVKLPEKAPHLCQGVISTAKWVTFPTGTKFINEGSRDTSPVVLPNVEFDISQTAQDMFPHRDIPFYMVYDAATCPGSSGALVLNDANYCHVDFNYQSTPHSCAYGKDADWTSCSGLNFYSYV